MKKGLIAYLAVLFFMSFTSAAVINVPADYANIQDAINAASSGDTINVSGGTYTPADLGWNGAGFLRMNKSLTLKGTGSGLTILEGQHIHTVISPGDGIHSTCLWLESSNINLEGLTIKGCDWGIRASDAYVPTITEISDLSFDDVTITDNYGHGVVFENYSGVVFKRIDFTNCNANANGDRGIYISPTSKAEDFTLTNTNADDNKKSGFNCQGTLNGLTINGGTFNDNTGGLNYEGNGPYFGAGLELDGVSNVNINGIEANRNGLLGPDDCGGPAWNIAPFSMNGGAGILLKDDTINVDILNSKLNGNANGILVEWCKHWPTGAQPRGIHANNNEIIDNTKFGVSNQAPKLLLDAESNWWGACDGPSGVGSGSGDSISLNVTYIPWLGACVDNISADSSCLFSGSSVNFYANVSSNSSCIGPVIFSVNKNGTWQNYTGTLSDRGIGNYFTTITDLVGGTNVFWKIYAGDCYNHFSESLTQSFYVNQKTALIVDPVIPDGLNNWYVIEPSFTFTKDAAAGNVYYQWDSEDIFLYSAAFGLENIPNSPPMISAGVLELNYWADFGICGNETKNTDIINVDLVSPMIIELEPANNSEIYTSQPVISAYLEELYQSNSGINRSSVILSVDNTPVSTSIINGIDIIDAIVSINPLITLGEGWHTAKVFAQDNSGRSSELEWQFYVNLTKEPFNLNVAYPQSGGYDSRRVLFNLTTTDYAKIQYINWNEYTPEWKSICLNCVEYGTISKKTKLLLEGENNITIRATSLTGEVRESNILIFVDSIKPRIINQLPRRNKFVNGSSFYVKYTETNLDSIVLFWNNNENKELTCVAGKNQECSIAADLSDYNNQNISYWFEISDGINTINSTKRQIKIDTQSPTLNINSPDNFGGIPTYVMRVPLNISVGNLDINEKVSLYYLDENALTPRWNSLCSRCTGYGNSLTKLKSFSKGYHKLQIRALDKAGNSDTKIAEFNII